LYDYERNAWVIGAAQLGCSIADLVRDAVRERLHRVAARAGREPDHG
jgi:hypothetical protein